MMKFLYPPRPEKAVPPEMIPYYERKGWWAQIKKNGTCNVVMVGNDSDPTFRTRHNEPNKAWIPTAEIEDYFRQFPGSVFAGELLHNKSASVKNTFYIFDIIRFHAVDLVGMDFQFREGLLQTLPQTNNVLVANTYRKHLMELFNSLKDDIDEGIVLKNPQGILKPCFVDGMNAGWQTKVRRPTKNFGF